MGEYMKLSDEEMREIQAEMREAAKECYQRPQYHFLPEAGWTNDPNGTIFNGGYYHLFFQHNPFFETWGFIHWGHARSKDLLHWERLPHALKPSTERGEEHCYSGCCVDDGNLLTAIYTSIGPKKPAFERAEQWAATSRDGGIIWEKLPENPLMTGDLHGELWTKIRDWRDPYVWREEATWCAVLGGHLEEKIPREGKRDKKRNIPTVFFYTSPDLRQWTFQGFLHQESTGTSIQGYTNKKWKMKNIECPNFFPVNHENRIYCLIVAPHERIVYQLGTFTPDHKFKPGEANGGQFERAGWHALDLGHSYYATNTIIEPDRILLFGWIREGGTGGWNGCISLPRVLRSRSDGYLEIKPAQGLQKLRKNTVNLGKLVIPEGTSNLLDFLRNHNSPLAPELGALLEGCNRKLELELVLTQWPEAFEISIYPEDQIEKSPLDRTLGFDFEENLVFMGALDGGAFEFLSGEETLKLHIFIDNSVVEIFLNDRVCLTKRVFHTKDAVPEITISSEKGVLTVERIEFHGLNGIWDKI